MKISEYIDLFEKELFESCVPFWLNHGADAEYGGLISCLDRGGDNQSTGKKGRVRGGGG